MQLDSLAFKKINMSQPKDYLADLLQLSEGLKLFLENAEHCNENLADADLAALQEQAEASLEAFTDVTQLAEQALGANVLSSGFKEIAFVAKVIKTWPLNPKQKEILDFLNQHNVNAKIIKVVDDAITEDQGSLLALLNLDLKTELIIMLESQVQQFEANAKQFIKAQSLEEKRSSLTKLIGKTATELQPEELLFDPFTEGLMSVNDIELTIVAIAVLVMLKPNRLS